MPVVWSDRCLLHDPGREIWVGLPTEASEVPARVDRILDTLARPDLHLAEAHDDEILKSIHDADLLRFLESAWDEWQASGLPEDPGRPASSRTSSPTPASAVHSSSRPQSRRRRASSRTTR